MPIANNIRAKVIRADAVLSNSYVAGNILSSADNNNLLGLEVLITDLSTTATIQLKIEESMDGTNYFQQVTETTSGATITTVGAVHHWAADPSGSYALLIHPVRAKYIKVSVKSTGTITLASATINGYLTNNEIGM